MRARRCNLRLLQDATRGIARCKSRGRSANRKVRVKLRPRSTNLRFFIAVKITGDKMYRVYGVPYTAIHEASGGSQVGGSARARTYARATRRMHVMHRGGVHSSRRQVAGSLDRWVRGGITFRSHTFQVQDLQPIV